MSRIGKKPIKIPTGVEAKIEGNKMFFKGPKGSLDLELNPGVEVTIKDGMITIVPTSQDKKTRAIWGLYGALIGWRIKGITEGFEKKLEIVGLGYGAAVEGKNLVLKVGFSHPVKIEKPEGMEFSVEKSVLTIKGIDKEKVGNMAAKIRSIKPPEPYLGKGVRYFGEQVRKKLGKKAAKATA